MKINLRTVLFLASVPLIVSNPCALAHTDVTAEQARDLIDSTNDLIVVDVREPSEYCDAIGHIPGALNYPLTSGVLQARYEELPMHGPVLVVCRSGGRSDRAASFLDSKGFSMVYDMLGGMMAWIWDTEPCKYSGGNGTAGDPYLIYAAEQMNAIGAEPNDWDKHFKLMADISLAGFTGTDFNIIGIDWDNSFTGVFDGNGHTISNFNYTSTDWIAVGLFGYVQGENALIKDLGLIDPNLDAGTSALSYGGQYIGSLVGRLHEGTITRCYVEGGSVSGNDRVGGLVGLINYGTITDCYATGSVAGAGSQYSGGTGGLVGENTGGATITNCYSSGSVTGTTIVGGLVGSHWWGIITNCTSSGSVLASGPEWWPGGGGGGGLVGVNWEGTISDCSSTGSVAGTTNVGGLVGVNWDTITNCYATGTVSGETKVGGLVGLNNYLGTITGSYAISTVTGDDSVGGLAGYNEEILAHCYATGSVSGTTNVGGLVGDNSYNTITNCYATASVSGTANVGGLVGAGDQWGFGEVTFSFWDIQTSGQSTSASGTGKTTAEMQDPNTFMDAGWDFVGKPDGSHDFWAEPAGGGYPILWWQLSPLPELPTFSGGTGEPEDPYLVSTAADLNNIGHNPRLMRAHFKLTNDIDLAGIDFYIIGGEAFPFTGVFDGNGHTISNFSYTSTLYRTEGIGLFGYVDDPNAEIRDLGLIAPNISGRYDVGSLVGQLSYGTVSGCYAQGGSVIVMGTGFGVGGLVGENTGSATITNCYATVSVLGNTRVGGLVGYNWGTITYCYSAGSVMGDDNVGGLVGTNSFYGTIADCYATSSVVGIEHVGGLVGSGGCAHNSFWDVQTSGQTTSAGGQGRTTAQMQMASTFLGWDGCGNGGVWTIDEGNDYPRLWWENKPGEVLETQQLSDLLTGAGTKDDPYLIYTAEELNVIGVFPCELDKHFKLMSDIDLSHYVGTEFNIIGIPSPFTGVFDGNGKKITNLDHTIGLFVSVSGAIRDLGLIDANVDAGTGSSVGSLVGENTWGATITNCYSSGSVSGNYYVGGLVGNNWGTITDCYATVSVLGNTNLGGLVGRNYGTITNCYATGSVLASGPEWQPGVVGGLVGEMGENWGEVTDSFWDTQTSGQVTSAGGTGKTTAEMQTESTFTDAGWDFVDETNNGTEDIWWIFESQDYPRLWWELVEEP